MEVRRPEGVVVLPFAFYLTLPVYIAVFCH